MTPPTVCFGARDDSYGFFQTSKAGNIITFKLTYKSGYVTCDARKSSFHSKWGCLWNPLIPNQMATLITDKNRNLLLPKSDFLSDYRDCKFYSLPWATTKSPQLHFDNFSIPLMEKNKAWKVQVIRDLNPWTLQYRCSALPNELTWFSYIHFTGLLRTNIMSVERKTDQNKII